MINENLARQAQGANSFRDYKEGSATSGYNQMVDKARERAERAKKKVELEYHTKIDAVVDRYATLLAQNLNEGNAIRSRVPSVMISGAGNFPTRKKEKQNQAMDRNFRQFHEIQNLLHKIDSIGKGGIRSDAVDAKEKISKKLAVAEKKQASMKKINAYYRKHGTVKGCNDVSDQLAEKIEDSINNSPYEAPFPPYALSNNNAEIKRLKKRLEGMATIEETSYDNFTFDNGEVIFNKEIQRIQILFDDKPDSDMRTKLKSKAFKWAPSQGAWQRQLTQNAIYALNSLNLKNE